MGSLSHLSLISSYINLLVAINFAADKLKNMQFKFHKQHLNNNDKVPNIYLISNHCSEQLN